MGNSDVSRVISRDVILNCVRISQIAHSPTLVYVYTSCLPSQLSFYYVILYIFSLFATTIILYKVILFFFLCTAYVQVLIVSIIQVIIHQGYWDGFGFFSVPTRFTVHYHPNVNVNDDNFIVEILSFYTFIHVLYALYLLYLLSK